MRVHVGAAATPEEAEAIAVSLAEHLGVDVDIHVGNGDEPAASAEAPETAYPLDDDLGPTDRERDLRAEIDDILQGGPEKYRDRLSERGKLFVRDRLDLWFGGEGGTRGAGDASASDGDPARTGSSPRSTTGTRTRRTATPTTKGTSPRRRATASPPTACSPVRPSSRAATSTSWLTTSP